MSPPKNNDPLGYLDELRDALDSLPEAVSHHLSTAASSQKDEARWDTVAKTVKDDQELCGHTCLVLSSLGFCRLYGIILPPDIERPLRSPLPPELLVPAIDATLRMLDAATDDARTLLERFDDAEPLEDRSYCTSLLHILMECWAIFVIVDDEYQQHLCSGQSTESQFGSWMRRLLDAFDALDDEIQRDEQISLLSVATELPLLDNWRKMLVEPYCDPLPWWLDGTLEAAAENVRQFIESDQTFTSVAIRPRPQALAMLANRNQEIASQAASVALAASAGEITGPQADSLLHKTWQLVGDPEVQIRLELRPDQNNQRLFAVELIGAAEKTDKYRKVEIRFRSGMSRQDSFQLGWTGLELNSNEIDEIESLTVVDVDGKRLHVNLEEPLSGN